MKIFCVVGSDSKKVYKVFHHYKSAVTWVSLHDSNKDSFLKVVKIDLDEYMKQIM